MFSSKQVVALMSFLVASYHSSDAFVPSKTVTITSRQSTGSNIASSSSSCLTLATNNDNNNNNNNNDNDEQISDRRNFLQQFATATATAAATLISSSQQSSPAIAATDAIGVQVGGKIVFGDESIMSSKAHGTSELPVQSDLLYGVNNKLADKICNYNRHFAEMGGYFRNTNFEDIVREAKGQPITFYDSVTGKPLFVAPINRSPEEFIQESEVHGWPSFRDEEVVWDNVRVLKNSGETVSIDGTHLGHNLPDRKGNRYCINLVSVAGKPMSA